MNKETTEREIITTDIDFSAWLLLQPVRLAKIAPKKEDSKVLVFVFECQSSEQKWALETTWQGGNVAVAARPFGKSLSRIKAIMFSVRDSRMKERGRVMWDYEQPSINTIG